MKRVNVYKAQPHGSTTPEALTIVVKDEIPDGASEDRMALDARQQ